MISLKESTQYLIKNELQILYRLPENSGLWKFSNWSYGLYYLIPKPDKDVTGKEHYNISHLYRWKKIKMLANESNGMYKRLYILTKWGLSQECKAGLTSEDKLL